MAHIVLFERLAFQKTKTDDAGNPTILPDGPEEIVAKGHRVPEYVPEWQLAALAQSGKIVAVADPVEILPPPAPAFTIDAPPPPDFAARVEANASAPDFESGGSATEPVPAATEPAPADSRAAWEEYATSPAVGMSQEEATGYRNKAELIAAVNGRTSR